MTLQEHVYAIQNLISKGVSSDDKDFSNAFIAHLLKINRALLLQRKMEKNKEIHSTNKTIICMPFERGQLANCPNCNIPELDCYFFKGLGKLPKAIISTSGMSYVFRTIDGNILSQMSITNNKYGKYSAVKESKKGWFILENTPFVIWPKDKDHLDFKLGLIEFVAEDPEELALLNICGEDDNAPCIDTANNEFPIDSDLIHPLYQMTLQMLQVSMGMPEDDLNNSVSADSTKSLE